MEFIKTVVDLIEDSKFDICRKGYDAEQVDILMNAIKKEAQKVYEQMLNINENYMKLKVLQYEIEEMHSKAEQILKSAEEEGSLKREQMIMEAKQQADRIRFGLNAETAERLLRSQELLSKIEKGLLDIKTDYDTYRLITNKNSVISDSN